jgi:hypothetical protein
MKLIKEKRIANKKLKPKISQNQLKENMKDIKKIDK